jgi:CubicO group peptidase (beta-lactamase class C family)
MHFMQKCLFGLVLLWVLAAVSWISAEESNGDLEKRRAFRRPENRAAKFRSAEEAFPRRLVHASTNVWKLERASPNRTWEPVYVWGGRTNTLAEFHERTKTSAFLVIKDDRILIETYLAGGNEKSRFFSFSAAKSITSTLVGMALEDGKIDSLEDALIKYLPSLTGSAFETATIKDTLQMMTGVHDPEPDSWDDESIPFVQQIRDSMTEQKYRFVEGANRLRPERPPGTKFNYSTMNTAILGWLVETVTHKRLATYMEERLWQPGGMESDCAWFLDGPPEIGREMAGGDFAATLRDFGRFGLMMLHQGRANGRQLVSARWVKEATTPDRPGIQYGKLAKDYPLGYGYYWWLFPSGRFTAQGMYGQFIYVAPDANAVIVKLSFWPEPGWLPDLEMESYALFEALIDGLK